MQDDKTPRRIGVLDMLRNSNQVQYVIPAYQRNYTWTANNEVKKLLEDILSMLTGPRDKHFLGIMIYLQKTVRVFNIECSVIDGQQRLTTIFLLLYAIKEKMIEKGKKDEAEQLESVYLVNNIGEKRYKLKPLVSDDAVYQKIVRGELDKIDEKQSNVYLNFKYMMDWVDNKLQLYTFEEILEALEKLYIVFIPIDDDDYPQQIFESINATGAKLTASDLIRNYILMPIPSDKQDEYYKKYWLALEELVSSDSKHLESFFRSFIMVLQYTIVNKNAVYNAFVGWFEEKEKSTSVEDIFKEIVRYAHYYHSIFQTPIDLLPHVLRKPVSEYRLIKSEMPVPMLLGYFRLNDEYHNSQKGINDNQLAEIITTLNSYIVRRALCDMNTSSITRYFPLLLHRTVDECKDDYSDIVTVFKKDLINNNRGSAQEMPDDKTVRDRISTANIYNLRTWVFLFFRKLESENNSAPVDFAKLNIEHLMPQTSTNQWLVNLDINRDEYEEHVHRLGNLTLAASSDNSKMSNHYWAEKKEILSSTAHLKINQNLLKKDDWTIDYIDNRTSELIDEIIRLYPYDAVQDEEKIAIFLSTPSNEYNARAYFYPNSGSVEILKGSKIDSKTLDYPIIEELRNKMKEDGTLKVTGEGIFFTKDKIFSSSRGTALSTTAAIILHGSRNGKECWKTQDGNPIYMLINKQ